MFLSNSWTRFTRLYEDKPFLVLALKGSATARCVNGHHSFIFSTVYCKVMLSVLLLFCREVVSDSLRPHGLWPSLCPLLSPRVCSYSRPLNWWRYLTIASSVATLDPGTVACQDPLSMRFSRQEYWSRLPFPSPD